MRVFLAALMCAGQASALSEIQDCHAQVGRVYESFAELQGAISRELGALAPSQGDPALDSIKALDALTDANTGAMADYVANMNTACARLPGESQEVLDRLGD